MKTTMKIFTVVLVFMSVLVSAESEKKSGTVTGQLIDGVTQQPLVGANIVIIELPAIGASTDPDGNFTIGNVPVGEYSLRTSLLGYTQAVLTNVVVSTGRSSKIKIRMFEEAIAVGEVVVRADYFSSEGSISPISTIGLNSAEVKRSPGSALDMQRIMQNLPSVANSNDQSNELIVRGGAPDENLTIMDHIEIPTTNHFPNQFNSGGPINMVNVDLIEDIRFSTGGFPANYGDKLSSVMDISLRDGDKDRSIAGEASAHFAGIGTLLEGGFAGGKGTWILSARQSFLETVDKITGISAIGITAIPKYYDLQSKITYEFSPTQKVIVNGIFGDDRILIEGMPDEKNDQKLFVKDSTGVETVDAHTKQYAVGATLRSLYGANGYSLFSLYLLGNRYDIDVREDYMYREYDGEGEVSTYRRLLSRPIYRNDATERLIGAKYDLIFRLYDHHELSAGFNLLTAEKFDNNVFFNSDTIRFDFNGDGAWDNTSTFRNGQSHTVIGFADEIKAGGYISDKIRVSDRLTATAGVRYDYFTYSQRGNVSPRINVSYELIPMVTKVNAAYGEYYQTLSFPLYGDYSGGKTNQYLDNAHARHVVVGIEHIFGEGLKGTLEAYFKQYDKLPVEEQFINSADRTFRSDKRLSVGKRRSSGIEIFLQQKQVEGLYYTFSLSYSSTVTTDPRLNLQGFPAVNAGEYPSEYDYPLLMTAVMGTVVKNVRTMLDEMPFYVKYPSYLFPFSNDMEISFRFRYSTGRPLTPKVFTPFEQRREGGITWSKGLWVDGAEINSERYPDYHRLDLQWLSRWHNDGYNIVVIAAIQNVYNRQNVGGYQYVSDGTRNTIYQFAFFPIIGMAVEF
jgi:hypothetical protein